jgi:hypothetical protein
MLALWGACAGAEDWVRDRIAGGYVEADMDSVLATSSGTRTVNFRFRWDPARALHDGRLYDAAESMWELDCDGRRFRIVFSRTLYQGAEVSGQKRTSDWRAIAPKNLLLNRACERSLR